MTHKLSNTNIGQAGAGMLSGILLCYFFALLMDSFAGM